MLPQHRQHHVGGFKQQKTTAVMCVFVIASMILAIFGWTALFRSFPSSLAVNKVTEAVLSRTEDDQIASDDRLGALHSESVSDRLQTSSSPMNDKETRIRERAKAAVLGAFVADAATMSLHWIYDASKIKSMLEGGKDPAFFEPPSCPFYQVPLGSFSPYGDEAMPTLQSAVKHNGIQGPSLTPDLAEAFSHAKGYVNSASRELMKNVQKGMTFPDASPADDQAHSLVKVPIVVARYAGLPELKDKVIEASRSHQRGEVPENYAVALAQVLEQVVLGKSIKDAVSHALSVADPAVLQAFKAAVETQASDVEDIVKAVQNFDPSCHIPGSFQGPLVAALHSSSYADAVRANIRAGGDQASRAHGVGALWAAQDGRGAIPDEWAAKVTVFNEVESLVDALLAQRP